MSDPPTRQLAQTRTPQRHPRRLRRLETRTGRLGQTADAPATQTDLALDALTAVALVALDPERLRVRRHARGDAPETPQASTYVDILSSQLRDRIGPDNDLRGALADAIEATAAQLHLTTGSAPSSTVAIVRAQPSVIDLLVLGDSAVVIGTDDGTEHVHTDDRLNRLGLPQADRYRQRLTTGTGYDDEHRRLLQELQRAESRQRNRRAGFWIAEADPTAAEHALTASYPRSHVAWALIATDGAFDVLPELGLDWQTIARENNSGLSRLLHRCNDWEANSDPNGIRLPRAERHDDKTIAVLQP